MNIRGLLVPILSDSHSEHLSPVRLAGNLDTLLGHENSGAIQRLVVNDKFLCSTTYVENISIWMKLS